MKVTSFIDIRCYRFFFHLSNLFIVCVCLSTHHRHLLHHHRWCFYCWWFRFSWFFFYLLRFFFCHWGRKVKIKKILVFFFAYFDNYPDSWKFTRLGARMDSEKKRFKNCFRFLLTPQPKKNEKISFLFFHNVKRNKNVQIDTETKKNKLEKRKKNSKEFKDKQHYMFWKIFFVFVCDFLFHIYIYIYIFSIYHQNHLHHDQNYHSIF